jgi:large subunit ribosomal protein L4
MTGGGIVHGPKPRDYSQRTPKKMVAAALLGALSDRARGARLHIVDSFGIEGAPSTKAAAAVFAEFGATKNVLVVIERNDELTIKSVRNLAYVHVLPVGQLNAYDVLVSDDIVFTKAAYDAFVASKTGATQEVSA